MEKVGFEMEKMGLSPAGVCAMLLGLWRQTAVGWDYSSSVLQLHDGGESGSPLWASLAMYTKLGQSCPVSWKLGEWYEE